MGKVVTGVGAQQGEYLSHRVFGPGGHMRHFSKGLSDVGNELGRHLGRCQDIVCLTCGNDAARHAVVLTGFGALRHHHAALSLDRLHPHCTIAAGTREYNANSHLLIALSQGAEE